MCRDLFKYGEYLWLQMHHLAFVTEDNFNVQARKYFKILAAKEPGDGIIHCTTLLQLIEVCDYLDSDNYELKQSFLEAFDEHPNLQIRQTTNGYVCKQLGSESKKADVRQDFDYKCLQEMRQQEKDADSSW